MVTSEKGVLILEVALVTGIPTMFSVLYKPVYSKLLLKVALRPIPNEGCSRS